VCLLTFDNKDRKIPVEYSEVVITLILCRNGDSEYLMNEISGKTSMSSPLLCNPGFGATNYAVIGQRTVRPDGFSGASGHQNLVEEAPGN